jgi:hypothetical protein
MRKVLVLLFVLTSMPLYCTQGRFCTYDIRQQIISDSLRVIDSIRISDSTHRADSLMIERYASSDERINRELRKTTRQEMADDSARNAVVPIHESEQDIFSPRSIVIAEDNENAGAIDSIQRTIDSINAGLYRNDAHFQKMEHLPFDEKKRYLHYLIENRLKDTTQVVLWCERMHAMLNLEQEKIRLIVKTQQDGNTKSFLMAHLKKTQDKLNRWSTLLIALAASQEKLRWKPVSGRKEQ